MHNIPLRTVHGVTHCSASRFVMLIPLTKSMLKQDRILLRKMIFTFYKNLSEIKSQYLFFSVLFFLKKFYFYFFKILIFIFLNFMMHSL